MNVERLGRIVESLQQTSGNVALTPAELIKVYEGRTSLAGAKLAEAYKERWITVTGKIDDVSGNSYGEATITVTDTVLVMMRFEKSLSGPVEALKKGDLVTVRGQVSTVDKNYIALVKCELINF